MDVYGLYLFIGTFAVFYVIVIAIILYTKLKEDKINFEKSNTESKEFVDNINNDMKL